MCKIFGIYKKQNWKFGILQIIFKHDKNFEQKIFYEQALTNT
jgi:hypothetical protein